MDDNAAGKIGTNLGEKLGRCDYVGVHNDLVKLSQECSNKDDFNQIVGKMNEYCQKNADKGLPKMNIHNDGWFGIGGQTDQIVLEKNGKKMEIFENAAHRNAEENENAKQAEPNHIDFGRMGDNSNNTWVGSRADYHTDSSISWTADNKNNGTGETTSDVRNGNTIGAYDYGNNAVRLNSPAQLNQIMESRKFRTPYRTSSY